LATGNSTSLARLADVTDPATHRRVFDVRKGNGAESTFVVHSIWLFPTRTISTVRYLRTTADNFSKTFLIRLLLADGHRAAARAEKLFL